MFLRESILPGFIFYLHVVHYLACGILLIAYRHFRIQADHLFFRSYLYGGVSTLDAEGTFYSRLTIIRPTTNSKVPIITSHPTGSRICAHRSYFHIRHLIASDNATDPNLVVTFKKYGIGVRFVTDDRPESFTAAIDDRTKAIYVESIGNPMYNVSPLPELAKVSAS